MLKFRQRGKYIEIFVILALVVGTAGFLLPKTNILAEEGEEGGTTEIQQLSEDIKDKQSQIEELRKKIDAYQQSLEIERSKANSSIFWKLKFRKKRLKSV
jgi:uncharacterized protein YlxW (UPF0749 family)